MAHFSSGTALRALETSSQITLTKPECCRTKTWLSKGTLSPMGAGLCILTPMNLSAAGVPLCVCVYLSRSIGSVAENPDHQQKVRVGKCCVSNSPMTAAIAAPAACQVRSF